MPPKKEPTRQQLSSKLSYQSRTPAFLQKLKNQMAGIPNDQSDDEDEPQYEGDGDYNRDEFEYVGGDRPPIPRRPPIPKRPKDQPGSDNEKSDRERDEEGDEAPQIVVLREGKHLTEREVENIKRKEKGLPPLPDENVPSTSNVTSENDQARDSNKTSVPKGNGLSFSSGKSKATSKAAAKRKALSQPDSDSDDLATKRGISKLKSVDKEKEKEKEKGKEKSKKKPKKDSKKLLSFGDDA